jgi:predicted nucleic acid-binding Zn ribbon protein
VHHETLCSHCRRQFDSVRSDAAYCSDSCRAMASQTRRKARSAAIETLLGRMTAALSTGGDEPALAALRSEAARLLAGDGK